MYFVRLTGLFDGEPTFINLAVVTEVALHGKGSSRIEFLSTGARAFALVKESPETVLALLPQNAKHEDIWQELGRERRKATAAA